MGLIQGRSAVGGSFSSSAGALCRSRGEKRWSLLPHQLQSLTDLFIAGSNLLILHACVSTSVHRGRLFLKWKTSSPQQAVAVSTAQSSFFEEKNQSTDSVKGHNQFDVAIASGNTGSFEMFLVAFWTFVLMLTLKGAIAFIMSRSVPGGGGSSEEQTEVTDTFLNRRKRLMSICGRLHAMCSCVSMSPSSSYCVSRASVAYLYFLWLITSSFLFILLGVPVSQYQSCLFFSSYLATLGLISPVAAGVIEELRSESLRRHAFSVTRMRALCTPSDTGEAYTDGVPATSSLERSPTFLRRVYPYLPAFLQAWLPLTFSPVRLGYVFVICALLPFIGCSFCALLSCFFLPLDWQTTYIHFPFPLVIGGTVGHFAGSVVSLLIVGFLLPCCSSLQQSSGGLVACPVLQELVLQRRQSHEGDWDDCEITVKRGGAPRTFPKKAGGSLVVPGTQFVNERGVRRRLRSIR